MEMKAALKEARRTTIMEMTASIQNIALQQGKRAVVTPRGGTFRQYKCSSSNCSWFVNASRTRNSLKGLTWHVTIANNQHINCTGISRATQRQAAESFVFTSAVAASIDTSASALADHLHLQDGVICSVSLVRRAKEDVIKRLHSTDLRYIGMLPSLLAELSSINLCLSTEMQVDANGRFYRAAIFMDPALIAGGQQAFDLDAAHMKNRQYNGVRTVLIARDGNLESATATVALAPNESAEMYRWFFGALLAKEFPLCPVPVFCDRHTRIIAAADALGVQVHFCTRHVGGHAWSAQDATTLAERIRALDRLAAVNGAALEHLSSIQRVGGLFIPISWPPNSMDGVRLISLRASKPRRSSISDGLNSRSTTFGRSAKSLWASASSGSRTVPHCGKPVGA
ncbi:hypothetical protein PybrP1_003594 [[Pythium] brassicae (nom. inval.)]|nr:hypothetical protein PybrP1_003594 [[Pythium] brassicae (nom. inval.)]